MTKTINERMTDCWIWRGLCRLHNWHETYKVKTGEYECVYNNMPAYGLGKVGKLIPAVGKKESAAQRISKVYPVIPAAKFYLPILWPNQRNKPYTKRFACKLKKEIIYTKEEILWPKQN